ncbi:MAG: hypothetical protein WC389_13825 [Lutibacter sp.]|jgi:hypothetical protein
MSEDLYYKNYSVKNLAKEILDSVKKSCPYDLTFSPTGNLTADEKQKLQEYLKYNFELWSKTWIIPQAEAIISKTRKIKDL